MGVLRRGALKAYRMARNFRGLKISRFSRINHEPRKFYPQKFYPRTAHTQCVVLLVSTRPSVVLSILCSVVVSIWLSTDIFQASEKSSCKLTDPRGPLSRLIPSSSIVSVYEKVQSVLESKERTQSGRKGQRYSKLAPKLKAKY